MWACKCSAAVSICVVNVANDTKMSYVLQRPLNAPGFSYLGSIWLGQVSVTFSVIGINLSDCERGGTRGKVREMKRESCGEKRKDLKSSKLSNSIIVV